MKLSDLDPVALDVACRRTFVYESIGPSWDHATDEVKATYRREIGATIAAYLSAIQTTTAPTVDASSSPSPATLTASETAP